jgi:hypothetical protein
MSNYPNPDDQRDSLYHPNARTGNAASGWAAGGILLLIVIGLAFGISHIPNNETPHNTTVNNAPPPITQPIGPGSRTYSPTPMSPTQTPTPQQPQP